MDGFKRKADGRRIFSVEFKRQVVGQIHSGEKTMAELSREFEVQPAVLRNWMALVDRGGTTLAVCRIANRKAYTFGAVIGRAAPNHAERGRRDHAHCRRTGADQRDIHGVFEPSGEELGGAVERVDKQELVGGKAGTTWS